MADDLTKRRRARAGHRAKRIEDAKALLGGAGTPDKVATARLAFTLQEKIEVLRQLDAEILGL